MWTRSRFAPQASRRGRIVSAGSSSAGSKRTSPASHFSAVDQVARGAMHPGPLSHINTRRVGMASVVAARRKGLALETYSGTFAGVAAKNQKPKIEVVEVSPCMAASLFLASSPRTSPLIVDKRQCRTRADQEEFPDLSNYNVPFGASSYTLAATLFHPPSTYGKASGCVTATAPPMTTAPETLAAVTAPW